MHNGEGDKISEHQRTDGVIKTIKHSRQVRDKVVQKFAAVKHFAAVALQEEQEIHSSGD